MCSLDWSLPHPPSRASCYPWSMRHSSETQGPAVLNAEVRTGVNVPWGKPLAKRLELANKFFSFLSSPSTHSILRPNGLFYKMMVPVLVSCGCCNKLPQIWVLKTQKGIILLFQRPEECSQYRGPTSRCQQEPCSPPEALGSLLHLSQLMVTIDIPWLVTFLQPLPPW